MNWMFWTNLSSISDCCTLLYFCLHLLFCFLKKMLLWRAKMSQATLWPVKILYKWLSNGVALDVLLIRVNSQIKLYFKKSKAHFLCLCIAVHLISPTLFKCNIIHTCWFSCVHCHCEVRWFTSLLLHFSHNCTVLSPQIGDLWSVLDQQGVGKRNWCLWSNLNVRIVQNLWQYK